MISDAEKVRLLENELMQTCSRVAIHIGELKDELRAACAQRDTFFAEAERLWDALQDAHETAREGWSYASPYFREKWGADEALARIKAALTPSAPEAKP